MDVRNRPNSLSEVAAVELRPLHREVNVVQPQFDVGRGRSKKYNGRDPERSSFPPGMLLSGPVTRAPGDG